MMQGWKLWMLGLLSVAVAAPTTDSGAELPPSAKPAVPKAMATSAPTAALSMAARTQLLGGQAPALGSASASANALTRAPTQLIAPDAHGPPAPGDEHSTQSKEVLVWGHEFAREVSAVLERWLTSGAVSEDKLFSALYYPVTGTDPMKFTTDYDTLGDRDLLAIQERVLAKSSLVVYAVTSDRNGYVPTHNRQFSLPLSGNRAVDLLSNRSKRIFGDVTGFRAARHEGPYLFQQYKRDTGEVMADLSVPLRVRGRHWGCVRIGYRPVDKP